MGYRGRCGIMVALAVVVDDTLILCCCSATAGSSGSQVKEARS